MPQLRHDLLAVCLGDVVHSAKHGATQLSVVLALRVKVGHFVGDGGRQQRHHAAGRMRRATTRETSPVLLGDIMALLAVVAGPFFAIIAPVLGLDLSHGGRRR